MATHTRAELGPVVDCTLDDCEGGLDEFEPEAQRSHVWQRVASPTPADMYRWQPYVAPARRRSWPLAVPVVLAASVAAGVALSWLGMPSNERAAATVTARPAATAAAPTAPPAPSITAPAVASPPSTHAVEQARVPDAPPVPPPPAPLDPDFERTLDVVSRAYRTLDPAALSMVWPGADTATLAAAFAELKYQALSFDRCALRANGDTGAVASCDVSIAAAPKSGEPALVRRRESWTLVMDRSGDRWTIAGVTTR